MFNMPCKWHLLALGPILPWLAACASVMSGSTQLMNVITEPSGAQCALTRNGKTIAQVNPTPGTVTIDKSAKSTVENVATAKIADLKKNCKKQDGCAADIAKLESERDTELAALEEKRLRATVESAISTDETMSPVPTDAPPPAAPPGVSPTEMTAYQAKRQEIELKWRARLATIRQIYCQDSGAAATDCERSTKAAEAGRDAEFAALDQKYGSGAAN